MYATENDQLVIKGKGARTRVISFDKESKQMQIVEKWLADAKEHNKHREHFLICKDGHRDAEKAKKSLHNWFYS